MMKSTVALAVGLFISAFLHAADKSAPTAAINKTAPSGNSNVIYILADDLGCGDLSC